MNTHLNPIGKILGGVGITSVNTFHFLSELSSTYIAYFHLFQSERLLHSVMVLESGSARKFSAMMVEKHELTIIVLRSYNYSTMIIHFFGTSIVDGNLLYAH
jgi:hypothetical protein